MVYSEIIQRMIRSVGSRHSSCLGAAKVLAANAGNCDIKLKIREEDSNTSGLAHNGFIATLVDVASACALRTHPVLMLKAGIRNDGLNFATSNMHISYMKSVKTGEEIVAEAHTVDISGSLAMVDLVLFDENTKEIRLKANTKFVGKFL